MKKICIFMSLVVLCTVLLSSCDNSGGNNTTKTTTASGSGEANGQTTLSAEETVKQQKEDAEVKKCVETLVLSKDPEKIKSVVRSCDDEYIQNVLATFVYDDYKVGLERIGSYNEYIIYYFEVKSETAEIAGEGFFCGVQIFVQTEKGLVIELDNKIVKEIYDKYRCRTCNGSGNKDYDEIQGVPYKCDVCKGKGVVM